MQRKEPIVSFEDQAPKKETKLNLDEFPLKSIKTIDDFKREIQGTSLLRAAQEQQNQRYLNFFYNIAAGDSDYERFCCAIHCFQSKETLDTLLSGHGNSWKTMLALYQEVERTSAFFAALSLENIVAMRCLLSKDRNMLLTPNEDGDRPPFYAAQHGKIKALTFFIKEAGVDYIATCEQHSKTKSTLLHTAILHEKTAAAKEVFQSLPDRLDRQDAEGYSPLHLAVLTQSEELVGMLLEADADAALTTFENAKFPKQTALQLAVTFGNSKIVLMLLAHALKHTVITAEITPAAIFTEFKSLLSLATNPVGDTSKLLGYLPVLFDSLTYAKIRDEEGASILTAVANTLYNKVYDENEEWVYTPDSKLRVVWALVVNIINGEANPVANFTVKQKAILQNGRLQTITASLFPPPESAENRKSPGKY